MRGENDGSRLHNNDSAHHGRRRSRGRPGPQPGGYFFTCAGNRRKRIREELKPKHTVTLTDNVEQAWALYLETLEGEGCTDELLMVTLALSGAIYNKMSLATRTLKVKRRPTRFMFPEAHRWPWPPSVTKRLRALRRQGLLTQPD